MLYLVQEGLPAVVLEDLVFACLVMVNLGPCITPGNADAGNDSSQIVFVGTLVDVLKAGPMQSKMHAAVVLSQIVLEGSSAIDAIVNSPDFLHHCTMLVCSSCDEAKSEAALLVNNLAALADEDVQCRLAGHTALVGALKSIVQYGGQVQQCRSAGAFMHLSKNSRPRAHLKSCCANEALEKTIRARIEDQQPTNEQRATVALASMAYINLSSGNPELLPQFPNAKNRLFLVQLLVELLTSSVQQHAKYGINWRLKDLLWSLRVLAGNSCYYNVLVKTGIVDILRMLQDSSPTSKYHDETPGILKGRVREHEQYIPKSAKCLYYVWEAERALAANSSTRHRRKN